MSFDRKDYPNRKDHRQPYRKSRVFDRSCRCNGSCGYCRGNRLHADALREAARPVPRCGTLADELARSRAEQPADIDDDDDDDDSDIYCPRA